MIQLKGITFYTPFILLSRRTSDFRNHEAQSSCLNPRNVVLIKIIVTFCSVIHIDTCMLKFCKEPLFTLPGMP